MGRKATKNKNLPPGLRARKQRSGKVYYYLDLGGKPRREKPLGSDYYAALKAYAELELQPQALPDAPTFRDAAKHYQTYDLIHKPPETQRDYTRSIERLCLFFDNPPAPLDGIKPEHVKQYLKWRGKQSKARANREKAVLSLIYNYARGEGMTDRPNPCAGIKGYSLKGRADIYPETEIVQAVYSHACAPLRDYIDLLYLTGQRPEDVRKSSKLHIKDGALTVVQAKTGKKLRLEIIGELKAVIDRINARKRTLAISTKFLVVNEQGFQIGKDALRYRFDKARSLAAAETDSSEKREAIREFQFRDLRAKAGTDKAESEGLEAAQAQLGHASKTMTEHYVRERLGTKTKPTR